MFQPKNDKQYTHDCNTCAYLGTIQEKGSLVVDLYVHKYGDAPNSQDSFIARYSSTGPDYTSVARAVVEQDFMISHSCRQAWRIEQDRLEVGEGNIYEEVQCT